MLPIKIRLGNDVVVDFLIAWFAEATGVMCFIFVLTLGCFLLISFCDIAEVAHKFSFESSI